VRHGTYHLLADTPDQFAQSVVQLLQDVASRRKLGRAARELVESKYSWASVARDFASALEGVLAKPMLT